MSLHQLDMASITEMGLGRLVRALSCRSSKKQFKRSLIEMSKHHCNPKRKQPRVVPSSVWSPAQRVGWHTQCCTPPAPAVYCRPPGTLHTQTIPVRRLPSPFSPPHSKAVININKHLSSSLPHQKAQDWFSIKQLHSCLAASHRQLCLPLAHNTISRKK